MSEDYPVSWMLDRVEVGSVSAVSQKHAASIFGFNVAR
jgi:hypothetical protein